MTDKSREYLAGIVVPAGRAYILSVLRRGGREMTPSEIESFSGKGFFHATTAKIDGLEAYGLITSRGRGASRGCSITSAGVAMLDLMDMRSDAERSAKAEMSQLFKAGVKGVRENPDVHLATLSIRPESRNKMICERVIRGETFASIADSIGRHPALVSVQYKMEFRRAMIETASAEVDRKWIAEGLTII